MEQNTPAITVSGLRRSYGRRAQAFEAVRGVDLEVARGSVTALLGTNGAGKTSTLEVVEGLAEGTAGVVRVLGLDPLKDRAEVRRRTGVLLQRSGFSGALTVRETLAMWASTLTRPRSVDEALGMLRLDDRAEVRVLGLSGGEQRRLDLACTLMGDPEVVMLDEPTTGLDPESRRDVWRLVEGLRDAGVGILLTTHYLEEAEALADHLLIMHEGRIVRSGSPADIAAGQAATITFATLPRPVEVLVGLPVADDHGLTTVETHDLQATLTDLLSWAAHHDVRLERLSASEAGLEAAFLAVAEGEPAPSTPRALEGRTR